MTVCLCRWTVLAALLTLATLSAAEQSPEDGSGRKERSLLVDIARELIARSGTSSQVLSLNLTNLVLLLVLKGLLLGVAAWGTGAWKGRGLEAPSPTLLSEPELALVISYLMGEANGKYNCLLNVACQQPKKTREYLAAGKMLLNTVKAMDKVMPVNPKYERLLTEMQKAVQFGSEENNICDQQYSCAGDNHVL